MVRPSRRRLGLRDAGAVVVSRGEKLHTAVLVTPASERRRLRKQRRQAAARLVAEQRHVEKEAAQAKAAAERAERRATVYLPAAGEPGPAALRTPGLCQVS